MHLVIETHEYISDAKHVGLSEDERQAISDAISADPQMGELVEGTGGVRKVRFGAKNKGKSGGVRVISFYAADDVPVLLLNVYSKSDSSTLTRAYKNQLKAMTATFAETYRKAAAERAAARKKRRTDP